MGGGEFIDPRILDFDTIYLEARVQIRASAALTPGERGSSTHSIEGQVNTTASQDAVGNRTSRVKVGVYID
jgi:hypothetical protein